jgi:ribulose-5-phosphate 4-epimerase/fuculose-1-phosphate aldolase
MGDWWTAPTTEREARVELAASYRMVSDLGWTDLGATHLSARVPSEPDAYLLLRQGLFFDEVTANNLVKVGLDGVVRDQDAEVNPAGVTIHSALLGARPDLVSVMHTHTPAGIAAACHPEGILPLSQHAMRFFEHQGVHAYEGIALDDVEGPRLVADLMEHELLLLQNHGLLTVGPSVPQAFSALYYAEMSAMIQVATLSSTDKPVLPTNEVSRHSFRQYASTGYQFRDWLGVVRQVERNHPGFDE